MSHPWKTRALASVLCLSMLTSGCFGPFNLTTRVHDWNDSVSENEWAQEGIFLGLSILFVYPFAMLGDALIFNSIEFWGGTNPIDPPTTAKLDDDGDVQADGSLAMR
jgi:hypothetical protein